MKFTIDTEQKVIEINEGCNISELINKLKELLGKDWKNYKLEQPLQWTCYPYIPYSPVIYDVTTPLDGTYKITCNSDGTDSWEVLTQN